MRFKYISRVIIVGKVTENINYGFAPLVFFKCVIREKILTFYSNK